MAAVQLAAIGASLGLLVLQGTLQGPGNTGFSIVIVVGIAALRVLTAGVSLAMSTLVIEPIGGVVLLAGTGGPTSPFLPIALSGIWWAALSPRGRHIRPFRIVRGSGILRVERGQQVEVGANRPTWLVYGVSLAASYALLVVLPAMREGLVAEAFEDAIVLGGAWLLAELAARAARRGVADAVPSAPATAEHVAPVGLASTADTVHLSRIESHLLACLAWGMSNRQIADRLQVSQGTVRYRLTRLYRSLGVHARDEAVSRARELGIALPTDLRGTGP